jgi:lysophospholipase
MNLSSRRRVPAALRIEAWPGLDGWPLRRFELKARGPAKGSLLFLGGRGDFFEKYLESLEHWSANGWNVAGFDWRGQGGSGRTHPAGLCHVEDFATFLADLAAYGEFWRTQTPGPHIAIGHSMGAHVLLRAAAQDLLELDGMVLLSPMIGIKAGLLRGRTLNRLAVIGRAPALRERPIWTGPSSPVPGRITSCAERHADKLWWKARHPELGRGAPTWGWLAAAARSMTALDGLLRRRVVTVPGLMLRAARDPVVDVGAILRVRRFLPGFDYGVIEQAGHELLRERDIPRGECMARIGSFLDERARLSRE